MTTYPLLTLIADDSDDDRILFSRAVGSLSGFSVAGITIDGLETLMYLKGFGPYGNRSRYPFPDVLLLDYEMPGYNGLEVLGYLCKAPRRPKVILWSSAIELIDRHAARELGAEVVCSKPVMMEEIQSTLLAAIEDDRAVSMMNRAWTSQRDRGMGVTCAANWLAPAATGI
jgi:CheY-like chemotaxis protein